SISSTLSDLPLKPNTAQSTDSDWFIWMDMELVLGCRRKIIHSADEKQTYGRFYANCLVRMRPSARRASDYRRRATGDRRFFTLTLSAALVCPATFLFRTAILAGWAVPVCPVCPACSPGGSRRLSGGSVTQVTQ
ncbi:MAG: hypothetical protein LUC96_07680, partial [Alistipes sp.]|uniref:hypothetical protein n=1 Tax=Alistipes sp. TaxID=1872444 RepID=UPI0025BA4851